MKSKIGLFLLIAASAIANTITPQLTFFTPGVSLVYSADLTSGEVQTGDGFTVFDVGGFTGFGAIAPGWTASSGTFLNPWGLAPLGVDGADINVTFTYTAAPTIQVQFGSTLFTPFTVLTTSLTLVTDDWVSKDHLLGDPTIIGDGAIGPGDRANINVTAPVPDGGATVILLGSALGCLAYWKTRRS